MYLPQTHDICDIWNYTYKYPVVENNMVYIIIYKERDRDRERAYHINLVVKCYKYYTLNVKYYVFFTVAAATVLVPT